MAKDFTTVFLVDQSPNQAFKAVTSVRGWWQVSMKKSSLAKPRNLTTNLPFAQALVRTTRGRD